MKTTSLKRLLSVLQRRNEAIFHNVDQKSSVERSSISCLSTVYCLFLHLSEKNQDSTSRVKIIYIPSETPSSASHH